MWVCLKIGYLSTAYNHHRFPYKKKHWPKKTSGHFWTIWNPLNSDHIYFTLGDGAFLCVTFHHKSWSPWRVLHRWTMAGPEAWFCNTVWKLDLDGTLKSSEKTEIGYKNHEQKSMDFRYPVHPQPIPSTTSPHPPAPRLSQPTPTWSQHQVFWLDDLQVCP